MSSRRSSRKPQKMRGPSRPVHPRYVPRAEARRGPDALVLGIVGAISVLVVVIGIWLLAGRGPAAATPATQPVVDTVPSITAQEALPLHSAGAATFIDVRNADISQQQRIKGAKTIPQGQIMARLNEVPRQGDVILYCQ